MLSDCGILEFSIFGHDVLDREKIGRANDVRGRLDLALWNEDWHEELLHSTVQHLCKW